VENCQVSVHAAYVSCRGQALVDAELYLPKAFALDPQRCAEAGVPPERAGRVITKGELAVRMFHRAVAAEMPFGYVAADEVYGRCPALRGAIEQAGYGYVLEVGSDFRVSHHPGDTSRADALVGEVPRWGWEQRCQGPGAKGAAHPRLGLGRPGPGRLPRDDARRNSPVLLSEIPHPGNEGNRRSLTLVVSCASAACRAVTARWARSAISRASPACAGSVRAC